MTVCVYAIVRAAPGRIGITGSAGERLRVVAQGPVAAIVGDRRTAPRPSETSLRAYDRVLGALAARVPALLPARFGTRAANDEALRVMLGDRQQALRRALAAVRGRVQMTVRIVDEPGAARRGRDAGDARRVSRSASPGRAYLEARAAALAREESVPAFDPVRPAIARWVRAERVEKHGRVATLYHLIPRAAAPRYRQTLERAAQGAGVRLIVSGPWPAYAFVDRW